MTREKLAPGTVLQKAYGVLDKYKLSRTFFVKTDQNSCDLAESTSSDSAHSTASTASSGTSSNSGTRKPVKKTTQKAKIGSPLPTIPPSAPAGISIGHDEAIVKPEPQADVKTQTEGEIVSEQKAEAAAA